MARRRRRNRPAFKARVVFAAVKGDLSCRTWRSSLMSSQSDRAMERQLLQRPGLVSGSSATSQ
jgi:hypothetical protein